MEPFFSIIVPIYNAAAYLDHCLDSIRGQRYDSFEVICVNDGSSDQSEEICSRYVAADDRFRLFSQPNAGVSAARNKGLDAAGGTYIVFVDSDDWVDEDYLEGLHDALDKQACDIVFQGYIEHRETGVTPVPFDEIADVYRKPIEGLYALEAIGRFGYICGKTFKTSIVRAHNIRFNPAISFREDEIFCLDYCYHIHSLEVIEGAAYHYRCGIPDSLAKRTYAYDAMWYAADCLAEKSYRLAEHFHSSLLGMLITRKLDVPYHTDALLSLYNAGEKTAKEKRIQALSLYYDRYAKYSRTPGLTFRIRVLLATLRVFGMENTNRILSLYYK